MNETSLLALLIDGVIAFTLVEAAALVLYRRIAGHGIAPRDFLVNMASGLCLMLALRCLVREAGVAWVALWLLAAGLAHGTDLWLRWQRGARGSAAVERVAA